MSVRSYFREMDEGGARNTLFALSVVISAAVVAAPNAAHAFCGFYVSGADAELYNNATQVVLMRDGTRTVLSMQNNYEGPPEDFALVIPVPSILEEENVKTLEDELFGRVDQFTAPRVVEYWEQDPCRPQVMYESRGVRRGMPMAVAESAPMADIDELVRVEAEFTVGEYDIVILSADESTALDTWLRQNEYQIPEGAEPYLRPYVESGLYFFVAKVDVEKVRFEDGQAMLSPLRFHYDTETFNLPIRLGLINAKDQQDLIVNILARGQRYEVANYPNATIPTNIEITEFAKDSFASFYNELFDRTRLANEEAVITEYSWDASTCDPCPGPALRGPDFLTLGADVMPGQPSGGFVITRLHARYTAGDIGEDLVFRAAPPIAGGREVRGQGGELEHGATSASRNNFQGRYIVRHHWEGPIECENPQRGIWGGPPGGGEPRPSAPTGRELLDTRSGDVVLATMIREPIRELGITPGETDPPIEGGGGDGAEGSGASGEDGAASADDSQQGGGQEGAGTGTEPSSGQTEETRRKDGCSVVGAAPGAGGGVAGLVVLALCLVRRRIA